MIRNLAQKRAQFALEKAQSARSLKQDPRRERNNDVGEEGKLSSFLAGAPVMILQNGLGQALAFWMADKKDNTNFLVRTIRDWLNRAECPERVENRDEADLMQKLTALDQYRYLRVQREVIQMLEWLKRFAKAFL